MSESLRLMAVHAHPDDESSKGAATLAKYAAEGVEVMVVTCTGGERGDVLNPSLKDDPALVRDIAEFRRGEMARAAEILGVQHRWLGFVDSGLPEGDPLPPLPQGCFALEPLDQAVAPLVRAVREFRPHVMTTYDENGGYPHPDHIRCHVVSVAAFEAAGDPEAYPDSGEPWQPLKLYYDRVFSWAKMSAMHAAIEAEGLNSPFAEWMQEREKRATQASPDGDTADEAQASAGFAELPITTRIRCDDYFDVRDQALLAHASQIDPQGWFFSIPMELQRRVWPTEDFLLARSLVDTPAEEDDLFAGLRAGPGELTPMVVQGRAR